MIMRDCAPQKGYWIQRCGAAAGHKAPTGQAAVQEKGDKPLRERHCEREDPPRRRGAPLGRKSAIAAAL